VSLRDLYLLLPDPFVIKIKLIYLPFKKKKKKKSSFRLAPFSRRNTILGFMKALHILLCGILAIAQWGDCFTVLHPPELVGTYNSPWLRNFPTNM
jgi:hypothetical protein